MCISGPRGLWCVKHHFRSTDFMCVLTHGRACKQIPAILWVHDQCFLHTVCGEPVWQAYHNEHNDNHLFSWPGHAFFARHQIAGIHFCSNISCVHALILYPPDRGCCWTECAVCCWGYSEDLEVKAWRGGGLSALNCLWNPKPRLLDRRCYKLVFFR
jgi:hypothetical protein